MTHYLRNSANETIVDVEATRDDLSCVVCIDTYSRMLLSLPEDRREQFIEDMNSTQEIRGYYFERVIVPGLCKNTAKGIDGFVHGFLRCIADSWDLAYVTD